MCSDHFHRWLPAQGHSGYFWSWLGAALEGTALSFGTVTAPGWRYHPAIVAQAAATLASMYPGRLWLALGSGEARNEEITGEPWPASRAERNARIAESADVIRRLWGGETVSHRGRIVVRDAKLYSGGGSSGGRAVGLQLGRDVIPILRTPAAFEAAARSVTADDLAVLMCISPGSGPACGLDRRVRGAWRRGGHAPRRRVESGRVHRHLCRSCPPRPARTGMSAP